MGMALFTFYVSFIYNKTTAMSDTDWIINSVIILFVTEGDEKFYDIIGACKQRREETSPLHSSSETDLEGEVLNLRQEVQSLGEVQHQNELLRDQNARLRNLLEVHPPEDASHSILQPVFGDRGSF